MSVDLNTWVEPFTTISQSTVKDIWAKSTEEIHKDLYMKLSTQAEQIAALTNLCEKFKSQIDEMSSLKGDIGAEIISLKGDIGAEVISLKGDIGCEMITLKGDINCEVNSLKAEIETLKRGAAQAAAELKEIDSDMKNDAAQAALDQEEVEKGWEDVYTLQKTCGELTKQILDVKTEMSSLLSGDFYIHAGGSPHGKISTKSGGTGGYCSLLSQDHHINVFTGYDVAADGTVKVNCPGRDDCYPLTQRWSFERATDKLINHPDGSHRLMSIPLNKSKVPV